VKGILLLQSCNSVCFEILLFGGFELLLLARSKVLGRGTWDVEATVAWETIA
jgi:hypothetical protein